MKEFNINFEEEYKIKQQALRQELQDHVDFCNRTDASFEERKLKLDRMIEIADEMSQLDTIHKRFLVLKFKKETEKYMKKLFKEMVKSTFKNGEQDE